ncbi:MAG TPA: helix-turn-helix domain-containing protein [Usitatibacter sp.]|nr:helix-turn-helix domain-containing protein [Usitatibacter sp.]
MITSLGNLPLKRIKAGETLYQSGSPLESLFVVRGGFFKSHIVHQDGRSQVTGFHMKEDLLGVDGLGTGAHHLDVVALEDSLVMVIPCTNLERITVHRAISVELERAHRTMMMLGTLKADERFAAFLLDLSRRLMACGYSPREFHLRMSRQEIGSFLGLSFETVSRLFSRFDKAGLIAVEKKHVRILDMPGLETVIAGEVKPESARRAA